MLYIALIVPLLRVSDREFFNIYCQCWHSSHCHVHIVFDYQQGAVNDYADMCPHSQWLCVHRVSVINNYVVTQFSTCLNLTLLVHRLFLILKTKQFKCHEHFHAVKYFTDTFPHSSQLCWHWDYMYIVNDYTTTSSLPVVDYMCTHEFCEYFREIANSCEIPCIDFAELFHAKGISTYWLTKQVIM